MDATAHSGLPTRGHLLIHAVTGDVDNDGDLDILFAHRWVGGLQIWLNESTPGRLFFRTGPDLAHLPLAEELDSALLADFDNDGILDLYVMLQERNGNNLPNLLARGLGNGDFADASAEWGGRGEVESLPCGSWPIDLDRDGDLDLMLVHGKEIHPERAGICILYENLTTNRGVTLTLEQPEVSPHGMGARVALHSGSRVQFRQVHSVMNHFNSTVLPLHFGLGTDSEPYRAVVTWSDGKRQEFVLPHADTAYLLRAGKKRAEELH